MSMVWETALTKSDVANGNIRFATSTLSLGTEYFGGTNSDEPATQRLTVVFSPGSTSKQWLYGDKKIFANRNPHTKNFFERVGAKVGTRIRVTRSSPNALLIEKVI